MRVLIAGASTRAAAQSAARAGFDVTALDVFGDRDQHPAVRARSVVRDLGSRPTAAAIARASRAFEVDAVAYLSPFENHPRAVAALAAGRTLLGNPPDVLRRVRDPQRLASALRERGFATPRLGDDGLLKPLRSGGGRRIRRWRAVKNRPTPQIPAGHYLQEFVDGVPGSVVFMSGAGKCVPAAVTQQIVGDAAFGASGFRYCGSLLASAGPVGAERLAAAVTEAFGLVGLNVVDFIARDGVPYAIEVNPRWSASMELVDDVVDTPLFGIHARLCMSGEPPPVFLSWRGVRRGPVLGKAIVFARRDVVIPDTDAWLEDPAIRDVPHAGERMMRGQPVCTVLADGFTAAACYEALTRKAAGVYRILDPVHRFEGQFDA